MSSPDQESPAPVGGLDVVHLEGFGGGFPVDERTRPSDVWIVAADVLGQFLGVVHETILWDDRLAVLPVGRTLGIFDERLGGAKLVSGLVKLHLGLVAVLVSFLV